MPDSMFFVTLPSLNINFSKGGGGEDEERRNLHKELSDQGMMTLHRRPMQCLLIFKILVELMKCDHCFHHKGRKGKFSIFSGAGQASRILWDNLLPRERVEGEGP